MSGHHHRSGGLSQSNKKNKRSNASKRSVGRLNGGRVEGRVGFKQRLVTHNKADRLHIQQQKRESKRVELLRRKRGLDGGPPPPRVIGVISLSESEQLEEKLRSLILDQADSVYKTYGEENNSTISAKYEIHKKDGHLTVLTNSTAFRSQYSTENGDDGAVLAALDLARVCDMIIFVVDGNATKAGDIVLGISIGGDDQSVRTNKTSATSQDFDHLISERGDRVLAAVKGQGLPRLLTILARTERDKEAGEDYMTTQSAKSLRRGNLKRKTDLKKYVSRFATTEFGVDNEKVVEVDLTESEHDDDDMEHDDMDDRAVDPDEHVKNTLAASLVRTLCTAAASPSKWVANMPRAYVLSDSHQYNPETQELEITGYIRGIVPFEINALMHVPNLGTFACKAVKKATRPNARKIKDTGKNNDVDVLGSDPMKREHLEMFATPDSLEGEQNLIGFDEAEEVFDENDDDEEEKEGEKNFARPAGWSDYQSAWLDGVEDGGSVGDGEMDNGELAKELNKKSNKSVAPDEIMDLDDANMVSEEERRLLLEQRRKEQHDHQEFPDEVQVNDDEKARDRFARYRSLKSFRQSPWDAKENLPETYASIFHFASFKATQRSVMSEMRQLAKAARLANENFWGRDLNKNESNVDAAMDASDDEDEDILEGCVPSGSYITLVLEKVSQKAYSEVSPDAAPLAVVTLLAHENKVSVLHMGLSQNQGCDMSQDIPVKSKDVLTFRCGWRTWTGRPVFSQHNLNSDKHKFERFLPQGGAFFAASVFGPVTYTHCPVLVFRDHKGQKELVAIGSMIGADADRIVIKRIVLTGYPVRVHKRHATVKYMFSDPEDVKWFKPAGLTTKHGLNGNIEASVGEHGTMKCLFNAPIKQHDTVCLPLYKRIFPKFPGVNVAGDDGGTVRSIRNRNVLVVK